MIFIDCNSLHIVVRRRESPSRRHLCRLQFGSVSLSGGRPKTSRLMSVEMRTPPEGGAASGVQNLGYGMSGDGVAEAQFLLR